ncbi:MAG: hypothetical protein QNJ38_16740 [Prochloraceae cyanobacterium]|nr:hypothetical protein [Prochloraceae cyanobacterium]
MLNYYISKEQASREFQEQKEFSVRKLSRSKATALGDWDGRVLAADPDPEMITNSHYWNAYCLGQYKRYLKKYGIKQVNEA